MCIEEYKEIQVGEVANTPVGNLLCKEGDTEFNSNCYLCFLQDGTGYPGNRIAKRFTEEEVEAVLEMSDWYGDGNICCFDVVGLCGNSMSREDGKQVYFEKQED